MATQITLKFDDYSNKVTVPGTLEEVEQASPNELLAWLCADDCVSSVEDGHKFQAQLKNRQGETLTYNGITAFLKRSLVKETELVPDCLDKVSPAKNKQAEQLDLDLLEV